MVSAKDPFSARIQAAIQEALTAERSADDLLVSVSDMRARMAKENGTDNPWNVKHVRGGLVDCEFIAQYLQLRYAHEQPHILDTGTVSAFRNLAAAAIIPQATADELIEATRLWRRLQGLLRLTLDGPADPASFPPPLKRRLAEAGQKTDFDSLELEIQRVAALTYSHFNDIIDTPAAQIRTKRETEANED